MVSHSLSVGCGSSVGVTVSHSLSVGCDSSVRVAVSHSLSVKRYSNLKTNFNFFLQMQKYNLNQSYVIWASCRVDIRFLNHITFEVDNIENRFTTGNSALNFWD